MAASSTDDNLMLGFLALQNDLVSREELIAAVGVWLKDRSTSLDAVLVCRSALSESEQRLLRSLADAHLARHDGDPRRSLVALSVASPARAELQALADPELTASLGPVPAHAAETATGPSGRVDRTVAPGGATLEPGDPAARIPADGLSTHGGGPSTGASRFRTVRHHASGGLGDVSVARDLELNREVALKEIQPRYANDANCRARFVLEAEVTGRLEHPGVVPVYGLSQHGDGRPFYAMRFIRGRSMTEAIRAYHGSNASLPERNLQFRELLHQFIDVSNAIAYAHSRGVLHRDLKPSNIMLGRYGEALVVDWGLAKVGTDPARTGSPTAAESVLRPTSASDSGSTLAGEVIGTPAYMSPEQASGKIDELGPATDIYSLGATLYEILCGVPSQGGEDVECVIRDVRSGRVRRPCDAKPGVPRALEAICLKAMALEPVARYAGASELAADVERWLADEVVTAWREPLLSRMRRRIRRHPSAVATISTLVLAAVVGLAAFSSIVASQKREVERKNLELDEARTSLAMKNDALVAAEAKARAEAETAQAVSTFLRGVLEETDPIAFGGRLFGQRAGTGGRSIRDLIQTATDRLHESFREKSDVRAMLLHTLGTVWLSLGENETSAPLLEEALKIREEAQEARHEDRIESTWALGRLEFARGHWIRSSRLMQRAHEDTRELLSREPAGPRRLQLETLLGHILFDRGVLVSQGHAEGIKRPEGETMLLESLEIRRRVLGEESREVCISLIALAALNSGNLRAIPYVQEAVKILDKLRGGRRFEEVAGKFIQAQQLLLLKQLERSEAAFRECLRLSAEVLPPDHAIVTMVHRQLAMLLYWHKKDPIAAEREWLQIHASYTSALGPENSVTADAEIYLARCRREVGDLARAKLHGRRSRDILVSQPDVDLKLLAACLDVWRGLLLGDCRRELREERVLIGRAWIEAETELRKILETLETRPIDSEERAVKVVERSRDHLRDLASERDRLTVQALGDWDELVRNGSPELSGLLDLRARLLAKDGRTTESIRAARELLGRDDLSSGHVHNAARVFVRAAGTITTTTTTTNNNAPGTPDDDARALRSSYLDESMALLARSIEMGWSDFDSLRDDEEFAALRDRPGFQAWLAAR